MTASVWHLAGALLPLQCPSYKASGFVLADNAIITIAVKGALSNALPFCHTQAYHPPIKQLVCSLAKSLFTTTNKPVQGFYMFS